MKYFKVRIVVGTSDSTFDIYYDSVNSGTRALLYDTGLPAIGLTNEVLETGEGVTVSVPDEASSIVLSSSPTAFCGDGTTNDSTFSILLGCISYTVSSSAGVFNYYYTDCNCIPVSATLDATSGYTEQTFCALQDSVNSGLLTIVDNGICLNTYEITYTNNITTQNIRLSIGNNGSSPSTTIYDGFYISDPITGTDINLPANDAIVSLVTEGRTITSATCNGVTQTGTGISITWYNVNGPLVVNFVTGALVCNANSSIVLRYSTSSASNACSALNAATYFTFNGSNFATTDLLYTNNNCTGVAPNGYYSNGTIVRYWNGSNLSTPIGCP